MAFYKPGIDLEGLPSLNPKPNPSIVTTKENAQQNVTGTFANRHTLNQRHFKRWKISQFVPNGRRLGNQDQNQTGNYFQNCGRNYNYGNNN